MNNKIRIGGDLMFFYVYKFEGKTENLYKLSSTEKKELGNLTFQIKDMVKRKVSSQVDNYKFLKQLEIEAILSISKEVNINNSKINSEAEIFFKFRADSHFVFLETNKQREKKDAIKCLNMWLNPFEVKLIEFIPLRNKEVDFICNANLKSAKLFTKNGIEDMADIKQEEESCKHIFMRYPLAEVNLELKVKEDRILLYFYGDAIQFPPYTTKIQIEQALQIFEKTMSDNDLNRLSNNVRRKIPETC